MRPDTSAIHRIADHDVVQARPGGKRETLQQCVGCGRMQVDAIDQQRPAGLGKPGQDTARERRNVFASLMDAVKTHSLGQISHALYEVGGEYRRNM